jgi:peptidoglycan/LPS O-acetylase OafA/YrhL
MKRLSFLDAIRGVAAFIVVCTHINFTIPEQTRWLTFPVLRFFRAGAYAVAIFFVLSGLVLFLQIETARPSYPAFVVRRAFRLFPAFLVAVMTSYTIYVFWNPASVPTLSAFFNDTTWPPGITFDAFISHLPLNGGSDALLRQTWSLVYEWRISLVFPIVAWAFVRHPGTAIAVSFSLALLLVGPFSWMTDAFANTAFYLSFFVAGMAIARWRREIVAFMRRSWILRAAIFLLCAYYVLGRSVSAGRGSWLQCGALAALMIIFCMSHPKARAILRSAPLQYLGRISYSLFLVHMIWIGVLFRLMDGNNPLLIAAAVIGASIASAGLLNRFVEQPANRFGRMLSSHMRWPLLAPVTVRLPAK